MRLIRFPPRPTRVSDDVRAALTAFSPGPDVVGGVALLGIRPPDTTQEVDAVLVLPQGVVIVTGIDLPHPAVRLQAPLAASWKLDGWPLPSTGEEDDTNPSSNALALARSVADRIHEVAASVPIGIILAVGPYVGHVEQPPVDLTEPIRITHPTSGTMRTRILSLMPPGSPAITAQQAGSLLRSLAPEASEPDLSVLVAEGFPRENRKSAETGRSAGHTTYSHSAPGSPIPRTPARPSTTSRRTTLSRTLPARTATGRKPRRRPPRPATGVSGTAPVPAPRQLRRTLRRAVATVGVLAVLATTAITIAGLRSMSEPEVAANTDKPEQLDDHVNITAQGVTFREVASAEHHRCSGHAIGDIDVWLSGSDCTKLERRSLTTTIGEQEIAVSAATVAFSHEEGARDFQSLVDTPGTGIIVDLARDKSRWPPPEPTFEHASYATLREETVVRVVRAAPHRGPSRPDDPDLKEAVEATLAIH